MKAYYLFSKTIKENEISSENFYLELSRSEPILPKNSRIIFTENSKKFELINSNPIYDRHKNIIIVPVELNNTKLNLDGEFDKFIEKNWLKRLPV